MDEGVSVVIDDVKFRIALEKYQKLTKKGTAEVLFEQGRLLAERLMRLTVPYKAADGRHAVENDINKVFLRSSWWEDKFSFSNQTLGERVQKLVRTKSQNDLEAIFEHSAKLNRIRIEPFDKSKHEAARRNGRVNYPAPFSYPLADQKLVRDYSRAKQKAVGTAKGGWGACLAALGGKPPQWANKSDYGAVENRSGDGEEAYIILTNKARHFAALDAQKDIVSRAMEGRAADMMKSAENQLRRAAEEAGLAG